MRTVRAVETSPFELLLPEDVFFGRVCVVVFVVVGRGSMLVLKKLVELRVEVLLVTVVSVAVAEVVVTVVEVAVTVVEVMLDVVVEVVVVVK